MENTQQQTMPTELELALKSLNDDYGQACAELGHEIFKASLQEERIDAMRLKVFNLNNKIKKHQEKLPAHTTQTTKAHEVTQ